MNVQLHLLSFYIIVNYVFVYSMQGQIYYEANEASASGPHQNFNAVSKADFFYCVKKSLKVNLL